MPLPAPTKLIEMYPYNIHPWSGPKFVADLELRSLGMNTWLENCQWTPAVSMLLGAPGPRSRSLLPTPRDPMIAFHLQMASQEAAVHTLWERNRVLYEIHPGLTKHLRTSGSDKFPPLVLQHLPHPNPLVFLADPVELTDPAGKQLRLLGWYVAGMEGHRYYCDTTDEVARAFHLTTVCEVLSPDKSQATDWDMTRVTLPITGADCTVEETIEDCLNGFHWDQSVQGQTEEKQRAYMSELLHVLVPHMLYLASQGLDTKPKDFRSPPPPRVNSWDRKPKGGGKVSRQLVGYRVGPALAAVGRWDESVEPGESRRTAEGRKAPVAHMRRAHFHTFRCGVGKVDRRVKWLPPIPVNADESPRETQAVKIK
jgi:hypothetical protein